jgi:putative MATE family efflux protein
MVGTLLAGRLGTGAGAAFALATQLAAMLFVLFRIIGAGISVAVSQALGGGRRDQADQVARASLGAASAIGVACLLLALWGAEGLLRWMNAPAEVAEVAAPLLRWLALGVLLDAWNATLASVLRSHLFARATLAVNATTQGLHLALAVPMMATWGLPGFAIALLCSRLLGFVLLLQLWQRRLGLQPRLSDWWRWRGDALAPVLQVGVPGAAENIAWRAAFMLSLAAVGHMGTAALATHAYALQVMHLLLLASMALGLAAEILVGHLVGAGALQAADRLVRRALTQGLVMSFVLACLAALAGPWLMGLFSADAEVIATGVQLLWLTVLIETGRSFNLVLVNALRAVGDARYPVQAGALSFALVLAGGSWALGLGLGWGLAGVWVAYAADEWLRGLINWQRWRSRRWLPGAIRMRRRLRQAGSAPP